MPENMDKSGKDLYKSYKMLVWLHLKRKHKNNNARYENIGRCCFIYVSGKFNLAYYLH